MITKRQHKRKITFIISALFLGLTFSGLTNNYAIAEEDTKTQEYLSFIQKFSDPIIEKDEVFVKIIVDEAESTVTAQGAPILPVFSKTYEFPWKTDIKSIDLIHSGIKTKFLTEKLEHVPFFRSIDSKSITTQDFDYDLISEYDDVYPNSWYSYRKGAGLNKKGEHVLFLSVDIYPVRYIPSEKTIQYINSAKINIVIGKTEEKKLNTETYDMVVISIDGFRNSLKPLIEHKDGYNIKTLFKPVEEIYESYSGRDKQEKIKYFIKESLETLNIKYVLLVGDIKKVPIRTTDAFPWYGEDGLLSDLYYADIYDENYSFCTWDSNDNNIFGEVIYNLSSWPYEIIDLDGVDLYPDLHIGRIPSRNRDEVESIVDKIIFYEDNTYDESWFKKIILAGGDTFPLRRGSFNVFEGEITNTKVAEELPDFEHIFLWASKRKLHFWTFNRAITQGAGFLSYAGHGFEHGWGTYRPNQISKNMIGYFTPYLQLIRNQNKQPIVFLDACLTAKLDFNISDLEKYFPKAVKIIELLTGVEHDPNNYYPVFGYAFLNKNNSGAIAVIGATRSAYTYVDKNGVHAGAGYLDVHFFKAYEEGITLGEMFTQAQNDYLNNVGKDHFTIEEYLILGDPSLRVGGYP